jgi:hypothetical protein
MAVFVNAPITDALAVEDLTAYTPVVGAAYVNSGVGSPVNFAHVAAGPIGNIRVVGAGASYGAFATAAPSADWTGQWDIAFDALVNGVGDYVAVAMRADIVADNAYLVVATITGNDGTNLTVTLTCYRRLAGAFVALPGGASLTGLIMVGNTFYTLQGKVLGTTISGQLGTNTQTFGTDSAITAAGEFGLWTFLSGTNAKFKNGLAFTGTLGVTPGTLALNGTVTSSSVPLQAPTDSGGTAPYSNQLQRVAHGAGFGSPTNIGSPVVGAAPTFTDATVAASTSYDYRVVVTDSASSTANSNTLNVVTPGVSATVAVSPSTGTTGTTPGITITVSGTTISSGVQSRFTMTGGTGASLGTITQTSTTTATGVLTCGSAAGNLTITDVTTGSTCTFVVSAPGNITVAADDGTCRYSGGSAGNWNVGGGQAITPNPGAVLERLFTGAVCTANFDVTHNTGGTAQVWAKVDGGAPVRYPLTATIDLTNGTPLSSTGLHYAELDFSSADSSQNQFNTPLNAGLYHTGFTFSGTATTTLPPARPYRILLLGDSITRGFGTLSLTDPIGADAMAGFAFELRHRLNADVVVVGFSGQGYTRGGQSGSNVPALPTSCSLVYQGVPRTLTGYDAAVIPMGLNDSGNLAGLPAAMHTTWTTLLNGGIPKVVQLSTLNVAFVDDVLSAAVTSFADSRVTYLSLAGYGYRGTVGVDSFDGTHPTAAFQLGEFAPRLAADLKTLLTGGGGSATPKHHGQLPRGR